LILEPLLKFYIRGHSKSFILEVTMTLTFDLVTQKWVWHVELIKVHLHMKFQSCRWKHFDFRAYVKVLY